MKTNDIKRSYAFEVFSKLLDNRDPNSFIDASKTYKTIARDAISVTNQIFDAFKEEDERER